MSVTDLLSTQPWGLEEARTAARHLLARHDRRRAARELVSCLVIQHPEQRVLAADVARRITERDTGFLARYAAELASILAETPIPESRARWHLGLVLAAPPAPQ